MAMFTGPLTLLHIYPSILSSVTVDVGQIYISETAVVNFCQQVALKRFGSLPSFNTGPRGLLPTSLRKHVFYYDSAQSAPCQAPDACSGGVGAAARVRRFAPRHASAPAALRLLKTRPAPGSRTADEPAPAPLRSPSWTLEIAFDGLGPLSFDPRNMKTSVSVVPQNTISISKFSSNSSALTNLCLWFSLCLKAEEKKKNKRLCMWK
ncbi:uncharacterized protein [Dasypus novemcinctus]|uniref:uncharacterized protein n=1 Tax=Dasypus novemcinctus TaxID=9361 RepID=UPI0039C9E674